LKREKKKEREREREREREYIVEKKYATKPSYAKE
jgi:hypothetical protein